MKKNLRPLIAIFVFLFQGTTTLAQHHGGNDSVKRDTRPVEVSTQKLFNYKGKKIYYDLYVADTIVNYTGKKRHAIAVNGSIPAPTLSFTQGDTAIIRVHNRMKQETSIHWHGLLLPNSEDGVPYLTTAPILPGKSYTFMFPLAQSGTYWYHSHTDVQEQSGLYGSIVIRRPDEPAMKEHVLVLSDWTDENPRQVLRYLKRGAEWYSVRKGALQSYGEAIAAGYFKDKLYQEWKRMTPMDVADVYYDQFLINGKPKSQFVDAKPGDVIKLRIINGSSSSYFLVQFAGGPMQVVAADGINVQPFMIDKIELATAETYDVLIKIPGNGSYELRATSWDITNFGSVFYGSGQEVKAPDIPRLNYFAMLKEMNEMMGSMDMSGGGMNMHNMHNMKQGQQGGMNHSGMPGMDSTKKQQPASRHEGHNMGNNPDQDKSMDHGQMPGMMDRLSGSGTTFTYDMLKSINPTVLDSTKKVREVKLTLTGNMLRYVWSFDNKTLAESDNILIRKGENVRFVMTNATMMRHPMHLHGHFFRFVNAQGDYSPMKHTFDIRPMETVTIEFYANEEKDWFFHCHNLYHMSSGMARIVSYEGSEKNIYAQDDYKTLKNHHDRNWYPWFDIVAHSQATFGQLTVSETKFAFESEARASYKGDFEIENHLLRYLGNQQYFAPFIGFDYRNNKSISRESNSKDNRKVFDAGFYYLLPMLVRSEWRVDHTGKLRLQLERSDLALSNNFFMDVQANTDKEYNLNFRYMFSRYFSLSSSYDSDYKWGIGLTLHY